MTEYPRIIQRLMCDDWAITPDAYQSLWTSLEAHMQGHQQVSADMLLMARQEREEASKPRKANGVATMSISGILGKRLSSLESMCGGVSVDSIVSTAERLVADKDIGTIVMDWNSPGGVVTGVPEAYDRLSELAKEKTFISYSDTRCCSAAQWLASAAPSFYVAGTADVGNVGVYNMVIDRTRQLANEGVEINAIHAGKFKLMGAPFRKLTDEERGMIQSRVNNTHANFKAAVSRGRPKLDQGALEGQVLTGRAAVAAGLADGIYPSLRSLLSAIVDRSQ